MTDNEPKYDGVFCRRLIRSVDRAVIGTSMVEATTSETTTNPRPYTSLVSVACDHDATPILMISDLAEHTRNIKTDSRVSVHYDGTSGYTNPLMGPRLSLFGCAQKSNSTRLKNRFLNRHPSSSMYKDFKDFNVYKINVECAHLIAGFGHISWIRGDDILFDTRCTGLLAAQEQNILAEINSHHSGKLRLCSRWILKRPEPNWKVSGIDPEGYDLRSGGSVARLLFKTVVSNEKEAKSELSSLSTLAKKRSETNPI